MNIAVNSADNVPFNLLNSARIGQQFGAASHSYDQAARLQRLTGSTLFETYLPLFSGLVLDLGCGTGVNTQHLCTTPAQVIGCDLAFDMAVKTKSLKIGVADHQRLSCIQGDAQHLPLASDQFEVVYSNLMLQWIDDLTVPLKEIKRVLLPHGQLLFTTLLDGTLTELKSAWAAIDSDNHVNSFSSLATVEQALAASGFEYHIEVVPIQLPYQNVNQLARELKYLGANYVKDRQHKGLMGRQKWSQLQHNYQVFRHNKGWLPATYRVAYIQATPKTNVVTI